MWITSKFLLIKKFKKNIFQNNYIQSSQPKPADWRRFLAAELGRKKVNGEGLELFPAWNRLFPITEGPNRTQNFERAKTHL